MIRVILLVGAIALTARLPAGSPASPPPRLPASLQEAGDSARATWQRRDLEAFVAGSGGGRLQITLPGGQGSAPISPQQAVAMLSSYVQGTQEITTLLKGAREVDSTQGYVELGRRYQLVGLPGDRESTILLGFLRGRQGWVMTEVRIGS